MKNTTNIYNIHTSIRVYQVLSKKCIDIPVSCRITYPNLSLTYDNCPPLCMLFELFEMSVVYMFLD